MKYCPRCRNAFLDTESACPEHGEGLQHDPLIGLDLGNFHVETWLGEGGMAVLYRAEHREIKLKVAVKVIKREYIEDATMSGRFVQEARMVAQLRHPHLIDIFDIGTLPDGRLYYVMELLVGRSLSQRMQQGRLSFHEFAPLIMQACEALELAHQQGIVHRDLKPDNLFIVEQPGEPPRIKVLDFGVAKVLRTDENLQEKLTRTGYIMGTPQYMAPEQIEGSGTDHRADIYAMGVILYELATGALPFQAQTLGAMLKAHLLESPPVFEQGKLAPGVPIELEAVAFKALVKKREDRYGSIRELRVELERLLQAQPPAATQWWVERATTGQTSLDTLPGHLRTTLVGKLPSLASTQAGLQPSTIVTAPRRSGLYIALGAGAALLLSGTGLGVYLHGRKNPPLETTTGDKSTAPDPKPKKPKLDTQALQSKALAVITTALGNGDPQIRRVALRALAAAKDSRHRTLAEPLLRDAAIDVRAEAANCLSSIGARPACQALREALGQDPALDLTLGEALVELHDPEGTKVLEKLLKRGRPELQLGAALALVEHKNHAAESLLKKRLGKAPPTDPSALAILGRLTKAGDPKSLAQLAERLESSEAGTQLLAADALAQAGDVRGLQKLTQIAGEPGPRQLLAYGMLAALEDPSGYEVFYKTLSESKDLGERIQAAQGLGASGDKSALSLLRPILEEEGELPLQVTVAGAVLAIVAADPQALATKSLDWASTALGDKNWLVRAQAVAVLADTNPKTAVPLLVKAIKDEQPEVRHAAVKVLGNTRAKEAVRYLGEALKDGAKTVRIAATRGLGKNRDKAAAVPLLTEHLAQAKTEEKVVTAGQLLAQGDKSGVQVVKDALKSNDPEMRRVAVEEAANDAAVQQDALAVALKDPSFDVRFQAALQLADKSSKEGVKVLQEAVKKGGTNALAGYAALLKLGVPPPKLDPYKLLVDPNVDTRLRALELAPQLPMGQILSFLRRGLADEDPRVRLAGMDALANYAGDDPKGPRVPMVREVLKKVVGDTDEALAAKAGALLAKLSPPERHGEGGAEDTTSPNGQPTVPVAAPPDLGASPDLTPPPDLAAPPDLTTLPDLVPPPPDLVAALQPPDNADQAQLLLLQGEAALKAGQYAKAIGHFKQALKLKPKLPAYFPLGEAYRRLAENSTQPAARRKALMQAIDAYRRSRDPRAAAYIKELQEDL
ncbi:MAG TPA: HEAT repeat domain-containing protein [Polyangia bacterium]|nr:HEAT repeat domain-containing protein [Polyangia bacterium]